MALIGIDLGTSGTKTVLFDEAGTVLASHTAEYPLSQPKNGWAEQDPHDWWRAVQETVQAVLAVHPRESVTVTVIVRLPAVLSALVVKDEPE